MKAIIGILTALGLVSNVALAQAQSTPLPSQEIDPAPAMDGSGASPTSQSGPAGESSPDASSGASNGNGMRSEAGMEQRQPPSPTAQLKPVTQDDVTYLCGGVGEEEASYMKSEAKGYDLMLIFAARNGEYLADVDVDIRDTKGKPVLQAACDAPILLVDLPRSGNYRVRAEAAGYTLNRTVRVNATGKALASAVLSWPQRVAEAGAATETSTGSSGKGRDSDTNSGTR